MRQKMDTSGTWSANGNGHVQVTKHNIARALNVDEPAIRDPSGTDYLQYLESSYMDWLLLPSQEDENRIVDTAVRMATGYQSSSTWTISGVQSREWHPYSASQRLISLICIQTLFSDQLDSEQSQVLETAIGFHSEHVRLRVEYDIHYNHLFKNLLALILASVYQTGSASVSRTQELISVLDYQLLSDGGHAERCPMYHALVQGDLQQLLTLGSDVLGSAQHAEILKRAQRMRAATAVMSFSNDTISLFSDSWHDESARPSTLGVTQAPLQPDEVAIQHLPVTGLVKVCTGEIEAIMDVGPAGADDNPGHNHDDFLAIEVCVAGKAIIGDYGVEAYGAGEARDRTRAAQYHNGPTVRGSYGMQNWGAFRTGMRCGSPQFFSVPPGDGWHIVTASHAPLYPDSLRLQRILAAHPNTGLLVIDQWHGRPNTLDATTTFDWLEDPATFSHNAVTARWAANATSTSVSRVFRRYGIARETTRMTLTPETDAGTTTLAFLRADIDDQKLRKLVGYIVTKSKGAVT